MVTKEEALSIPDFDCPTISLKDKIINGLDEIAVMRAKREDESSIDKLLDVQRHHFVGLCGEAAVGGYYSLPMNLNYQHPIDPGYDFLAQYIPTQDRIKIDVKTRTKWSADLLVSKTKTVKNADIFILCLKIDNNIVLYGSATQEMVLNSDVITKNSKEVYRVPREELYSVADRTKIRSVDLNMEGLSSVNVDKENLLTVEKT